MRFSGKIISVTIISFLISISFKANIELNSLFYNYKDEIIPIYNPNSYTISNEILIMHDGDFGLYSFINGNGSKSNPFLIENLNITASGVNVGIHITQTTSYFIIRNCLLSSNEYGIRIEEISNGTCVIKDNLFIDNDICIYTSESDGLIINGNIGFDNENGVYIDESDATQIIRNRFNFDRKGSIVGSLGIFFYRLRNSFVEHNKIENYTTSIFGYTSVFNNLLNNTCTNSSGEISFHLCNSFYSNIIGNSIQNCFDGIGIKLNGTSIGNVITHNLIENCTSYGIQIDDFTNQNNTIHHNNLLNNNLMGTSQGYDSGFQNIWYCSSALEGNYWSDWIGTGDYTIDGSSYIEDIFPLSDEVSIDLSQIEIQLLSLEVDDSYEDNDFFLSSTLIESCNNTYHLVGYDVDWFKIYLKSYQILTLNVTAIGAGLNINAALHQERIPYVLEYSDTVGESEIIVYTSIKSDYYNIEIDFYSLPTPSPNYTMKISISDDPSYRDEYEDNDSIEEAKIIEVDDNSYDLIYNDKDYFNVSLAAGYKFTAEITFSNILIDLDLFLLSYGDDKEEWIVARSTTQEAYERIEYIVTTTKNYYLLITSTDPNGSGVVIPIDYTLIVRYKINRGASVFVLLPFIFTMTYLYYRRKLSKTNYR